LKQLINECKPDIIVSVNHTPEQYFIPFLAGKTPTVKEFHSSGVTLHKPGTILEKLKHQLFLLLGRYTIKVVLNQDEKEYYPFDTIEVIPNFISPQQSENSRKEKIIISAGRIAPVKQFNHLIAAWSKIAHELTDWAVHIYGEGEAHLKKQLQNQIHQGQVPRIELKAATQDLDKRMQEGSIYAMTSATECFPMALLEAQAAGMAIISYDCPNGPRNIITNKVNGLLVENQSIDAFAKELKQLILNPFQQKEIQLKAQESITQFSEGQVMKIWDALFKSIIK
jgi:glycosyltransferase involved in cell wall biosynthesis